MPPTYCSTLTVEISYDLRIRTVLLKVPLRTPLTADQRQSRRFLFYSFTQHGSSPKKRCLTLGSFWITPGKVRRSSLTLHSPPGGRNRAITRNPTGPSPKLTGLRPQVSDSLSKPETIQRFRGVRGEWGRGRSEARKKIRRACDSGFDDAGFGARLDLCPLSS